MNNKNIIRSEILNKAADLIETEGWWQDFQTKPKKGYCAAIAMSHGSQLLSCLDLSSCFGSSYYDQYKFLAKDFSGIVGWNDKAGQTKEKVVSHLRFIANEYKKRG